MRTLVVRPDSMGDVLLAGPAVRALAATSTSLTMLVGPLGAGAASLLPGVDEVVRWGFPWILADPPDVAEGDVATLVGRLRRGRFDRAVVLTSFHQSALPTALLLRLAGVSWIGAYSEDYPGSLLDLRLAPPGPVPEAERSLRLAQEAGGALPAGDDGRLRVTGLLPDVADLVPSGPYVVLHPGTSAPARAWPLERFVEAARLLVATGSSVVATGAPSETSLTAALTEAGAIDLGGRTTLPQLAAVLAGARAVVVGNTGPAHLAAAVGTPVVSLFAPTVPLASWAPYGVPVQVLGDQTAACAATRALTCPVPGHPCLAAVTATDVQLAVEKLADTNEFDDTQLDEEGETQR
ncbi:MAG TPA: glycosyltransferase family 9 protein [Marmoricola sp.]|nr:glycosyltransferase family 9 protein [Marmoricola sp.]